MYLKTQRILIIALLVTVLHFLLTLLIGHYIAVRVGTQVGQTVAGGIIDVNAKGSQNHQKSEEEALRITQNMEDKIEGITTRWKIPLFLISLPIRPLLHSSLKDIRDTHRKMVLSKEISKDQFLKWAKTINYIVNFINSVCFGFLVYIILIISRHYKMKT